MKENTLRELEKEFNLQMEEINSSEHKKIMELENLSDITSSFVKRIDTNEYSTKNYSLIIDEAKDKTNMIYKKLKNQIEEDYYEKRKQIKNRKD